MSVLALLMAGFGVTIAVNYVAFRGLMRYLTRQLQRTPGKEPS